MIFDIIYLFFFSILLVIYLIFITVPVLYNKKSKKLTVVIIFKTIILPIIFVGYLISKFIKIIDYYNFF
jgi:uncharacterized membrane protein (DUF4010 family)